MRHTPSRLDIIRGILGGEDMPKKYQSGKLEIRRDLAGRTNSWGPR
jgi:hypothetical protein